MEFLPIEIVNKIMLYNIHPVAEMLQKEHPIMNHLENEKCFEWRTVDILKKCIIRNNKLIKQLEQEWNQQNKNNRM